MMKSKIQLLQGRLGVAVDGLMGPQTLRAFARCQGIELAGAGFGMHVKQVQAALGVPADGVVGPQTLAAMAGALGVALPFAFPTQAEVRSGKSVFGARGDESRLVFVRPAYLHFYDGKPMPRLRVNEAMAERCVAAWEAALKHYGATRIHELGLDVFDGCFCNRAIRNGAAASMHAFGAALDYDAAHNGNRVRAPQARFSAPEYAAWFDVWESLGFTCGGRAWGRDFMHIQAPRA